MLCPYPTVFPSTGGKKVPCGQCLACRINRRKEWLTKLVLEYRAFPNSSVFVTLTYAPEWLPEADKYPGGNLVKEDLQKFLKRLRHHYAKEYPGRSIRYFAVGEYGDKSQRAHYHLIIYNLDHLCAERLIKQAWPYGHVSVGSVTEKSMRYVLGYTIKKMTKEKDFPDGRQPEFTLSSRNPGLGMYAIPHFGEVLISKSMYPMRYFTDDEKFVLHRKIGFYPEYWTGNFSTNGKTYRLDDYMMQKLGEYVDEKIAMKQYAQDRLLDDFREDLQKFRVYKDAGKWFHNLKFEKEEIDEDFRKAKAKAEKQKRRYERSKKI